LTFSNLTDFRAPPSRPRRADAVNPLPRHDWGTILRMRWAARSVVLGPRRRDPRPPPSPHLRGIRPSEGRPSGASPAASWRGSGPVGRGRDDWAVGAKGSAVPTAGSWRAGPGRWVGPAGGPGRAVGRGVGRCGATRGSRAGPGARWRRQAQQAVGLTPRVSRCLAPTRTHRSVSLRTPPTEAITGLGADRAGSDRRDLVPPAHRPGKDELGLAGAGPAVRRPASGRDGPARAGPDPRPGRPAGECGHAPTAVRAVLSDIHQASVARVGVIDRSQLTCFGVVGPICAMFAVAARQEDAEFGGGRVFVGELPRASGRGADGSGQPRAPAPELLYRR
jgi:hypothetical protein